MTQQKRARSHNGSLQHRPHNQTPHGRASRLELKPLGPWGLSAYQRNGPFFPPNKNNLKFLITSPRNTRSWRKSLHRGKPDNYAVFGFFDFLKFCEIVEGTTKMTVSLINAKAQGQRGFGASPDARLWRPLHLREPPNIHRRRIPPFLGEVPHPKADIHYPSIDQSKHLSSLCVSEPLLSAVLILDSTWQGWAYPSNRNTRHFRSPLF
jgi:hypothetical protein